MLPVLGGTGLLKNVPAGPKSCSDQTGPLLNRVRVSGR